MFTQVISQILLAISLVSSSVQPSQVEVVTLPPNAEEQILEINPDEAIQFHQEIRNSCSRQGCSLASHK